MLTKIIPAVVTGLTAFAAAIAVLMVYITVKCNRAERAEREWNARRENIRRMGR